MGKVKYATGIDYVQGSLSKPTVKNGHSCGTYLIGTHREKATSNPSCTRLYVRAAETYQRTTQPSAKELQVRARFAAVRAMVAERADDLSHISSDQAAFIAQKDLANGKKTMRAYLWMVCGAEYDQEHSNG